MHGHNRRSAAIFLLILSTLAAWGLVPAAASAAVTKAAAASPAITNAATATPACTFNGGTLPIVTGVTGGSKVAISCTGLSPLHPYLLLETSLLIAIDPKAAALLSGGATLSPALLESALAALPEINPASFALPLSDLSGNLTENYTVPSFQPLDPNASCPPSVPEFNGGLLGCALAMVDLTTQKPVAAGSAVLEWQGYPFLPPDPTVAFSAPIARPGQQINVTDAPGATTYWWIATLASLESLLSGGSPPPVTLSVAFKAKHNTYVPATESLTATPATYDGKTFTPPSISGSFTVPTGVTGKHKVFVSLSMPLEGLTLQITAEAPVDVLR